ncbi:MAG: UDP-N-acetylmuramate dehydrogenase [Deltaproteobacteria bacterium]|nr:UDP-N-acetylmuramate dehydrogenase [Deltaproteobacteria bacterium]MCL5277846.1 UDP-N-acetylmuramate dehydrogenase [Deltaproteobacteria bacterium]
MVDFNELRSVVRGKVALDVPMSRHTSMKVGGRCACMFTPEDTDDILRFIDWSRDAGQKYVVIGSGTNLIVREGGIRCPAIRIKGTLDSMEIESEDSGTVRLRAGAGMPVAGLVKYCSDSGLSGIEPLAGIPGTVGGAVFMNAGTGGGSVEDVIEAVTFIERSGRTKTYGRDEMGFGYRTCRALSTSSIVVSAVLALKRTDIKRVQRKVEALLQSRAATQPLGYPSCGSIFKNPAGGVKAWKLLEEAGMRGVRIRGAMYSELHSNFIVNTGSAVAADVIALIDAGIEKVREKSGVRLELEAVIIGEEV